jgi:hypothetical protein
MRGLGWPVQCRVSTIPDDGRGANGPAQHIGPSGRRVAARRQNPHPELAARRLSASGQNSRRGHARSSRLSNTPGDPELPSAAPREGPVEAPERLAWRPGTNEAMNSPFRATRRRACPLLGAWPGERPRRAMPTRRIGTCGTGIANTWPAARPSDAAGLPSRASGICVPHVAKGQARRIACERLSVEH